MKLMTKHLQTIRDFYRIWYLVYSMVSLLLHFLFLFSLQVRAKYFSKNRIFFGKKKKNSQPKILKKNFFLCRKKCITRNTSQQTQKNSKSKAKKHTHSQKPNKIKFNIFDYIFKSNGILYILLYR